MREPKRNEPIPKWYFNQGLFCEFFISLYSKPQTVIEKLPCQASLKQHFQQRNFVNPN